MTRRPRSGGLTTALTVGALTLVACTSGSSGEIGGAAPGAVTVTSTDTECRLSATTAPSGTLAFDVTNAGEQVTEFYLLSQDGLRIVGEVENIGPGLQRRLVVQVTPGSYLTACKPGMAGDGIRAAFTVSDAG